MHQKFNTSRQHLIQKIFVPEPPQQGQVWTNLNITILPDYLAYIKQNLTKQQQLLLSDYHLQTYLLETALQPHPKNDFDFLTSQILRHIRDNVEFWVRKKGSEQESLKMHQAIQEYHQDCRVIDQCKDDWKIGDAYEDRAYRVPDQKKIQNDYVYIKNNFVKGGHRFHASLYPWIAEYISKLSQIKDKKSIKKFVTQFIIWLSIKAKPKHKAGYFNQAYIKASISDRIQKQLKNFNEYLQNKNENIDTKSLSSLKDYYIISNTLTICRQFFTPGHFSQANGNVSGDGSQMLLQNYVPFQQYLKQNKIDQILADLVNRFMTSDQLQAIIQYLQNGKYWEIMKFAQIREYEEESQRQKLRGFNGTEIDLQKAIENFNQIINHPENTNRMKYKLQGSELGWSEQLYLKFLQSFLQFFNVPTNNKKIALAMGKNIESNHVKHVKGLYMRNMATRIENGEIGGGKKGIFESKIQFLKKDIQNFNMKWFKKQGKNKSKKLKRRKRRQNQDGEEHDSDY